MARNALRDFRAWLNAALSGGATPTPEGSLTLTGQNQVDDFSFTALTQDGSESVVIEQSPSFDGYHVYVSQRNGGRSTLGRQTGSLLGANRKMFTADQPIIAGPRPRLTSSEGQQPAPPFELRKKSYSKNARGFRGGTRLAAVSAVSKNGAHTTLTYPVEFTHGNAENIKWNLPDEAPEGAVKWGLWLSAAVTPGNTPDPSTLRLQRTIPAKSREFTLTGPIRAGRRAPTTNETYVGRPRRPVFGRDAKMRRAAGDLRQMTDFAIAISEVTPRGESLVSPRSADRSVVGRLRRVRTLRQLKAGQDPGPNEHLVTIKGKRFGGRWVNRVRDRPHLAYWIRPVKTHPDTTRFKVYVRLGGKWYQLIDKKAVNPGAGSSIGSAMPFYGTVENSSEGGSSKAIQAAKRFVLSEATPPEEDASGIEAPTGEIDPPVGVGGASPTPGTYTVTYAPVIGGVEQRAAAPKRITIAEGETFQLIFPPRVNKLVNPAGADRDANDLPINWTYNLTLSGVSAGVPSNDTGKVGVRTNGVINDTGFGPQVTSDSVSVAGAVETLRGHLEVTDYVAGTGSASLVQYDASGIQVSAPNVSSLSRNGQTEFTRTIGPAGSGAALELHELCRSVALRFTCGNVSGRSLAVRGHTLALHPFEGAPRNFLFSPEGSSEIADPDPPLEIPFPETSVACITRPPKSAVSSPEQARIQTIGFDNVSGSDLPSPWQKNKYPDNANVTLEVSADGAIRGAKGLRVRSRATQTDTRAFYARSYPASLAPGDVLALRATVVIDELPTVVGYTSLFSISSPGTGFMAQAAFARGGMIYLRSRGAAGVIRARSALQASIGDVLDIEIYVRGGDTSAGDATMVAGINGSQREVVAFLGNHDWTNRDATQVVLGTGTEAGTSATYSYRMDDVVVSPYGDPGTVPTTEAVDVTLPDRPLEVQTSYDSGSGAVSKSVAVPQAANALWMVADGTVASGVENNVICQLRASGGQYLRAIASTGGVLRMTHTFATEVFIKDTSVSVAGGQSHRIELGIEGFGTENGKCYLYHRPSGASINERKLLSYNEGLDLSSLSASDILIPSGRYTSVQWSLYEHGEGVFRQIDDRNDEINQLYLFVPPGYETSPPQAVLEERILKPGRWTFGIYAKQSFAVESPWVITLRNEAGEQIEPLSVVQSNEAWGEWVVSFDVPPGFERVSAKFRPLGRGMWIFQEPAYFAGEPTASQRASWRNHAKQAGYFEAVLPLGVPDKEKLHNSREGYGERRVSLDAATDIPEGATFTTSWSYGPSEEGPWTAVEDPDQTPELIADAPFVKVEGTMLAGGEYNDLAPEIAPAGVSSDYVTELPILLREDGTSLSGGSVVTDLHRPYERPDYTEESVGGHARPVPLTEEIDRIEEGMVVYLYTPEAEAEFARDCLRHDWLLDYPAAGMQLRVRLYAAAERVPLDIPLLEEQTGYIWTSFEVGQLEVMERGGLDQSVAYEDSEGNPE